MSAFKRNAVDSLTKIEFFLKYVFFQNFPFFIIMLSIRDAHLCTFRPQGGASQPFSRD